MERIYVFYADVFWWNSFLQKFTVLILLSCFKTGRKRFFLTRLCVVAALASFFDLIFLFLIHSWSVYSALWNLFVFPLMIFFCFSWNGILCFLRDYGISYLFSLFLGGTMTAMKNLIPIKWSGGLLVVWGGILSFYLWRQVKVRQENLNRMEEVEIYQNEKQLRCGLLWDTGNLLTEKRTRKPIYIASESMLRNLGLTMEDAVGSVCYQAVGTECGVLLYYRLNSIRGSDFWEKDAFVAGGEDSLFAGKEYQIIGNVMSRTSGRGKMNVLDS